MKSTLLATVATVALFASPALADVISDDPLHGFCNGCSDNGTNTPIPSLQTQFGFTASPANTGDLILKFLIPNNTPAPTSISVTGTSNGTATRVAGTWTSGDLEAFLGIANASPANPIGAYLPSTQAFQASATGFNVFTFDAGQYSLPTPGNTPPDLFTVAGFAAPRGSYAVADLKLANGDDIATANSGALFVNTSISGVPGPVVGAGLPGLMAGLGALWALARRRRLCSAS